MKTPLCRTAFAIGSLLITQAAIAAQLEQVQMFLNEVVVYVIGLVIVLVAFYVYFMRLRDDRSAPLDKLVQGRPKVHSVAPEATVTECVRTMAQNRIGAIIVMDGEKLSGIFTERDALNKVLAAGLDPRSTRVSEVMTRDPYFVSPSVTVGAAMELVTARRFRHLPVVEDGKVVAVVSSGDLTHWLVKDNVGAARKLLDLQTGS